jgi:hypothetical protein
MPLVIALAYAGFILWLISKLKFFRIAGIQQWQMYGFFILKILAGMALAWIYTHWYTDRVAADTFKYFDDSEKLFELFHKDRKLFLQFVFGTTHYSPEYLEFSNSLNTWWNQYAIYNDGRTMVRINTLLRFISFGYYPVHNIVFCFITFCGLTAFCKAFLPYLKRYQKLFVCFLFLFPSLTFWSSGVMKDGIILAGTGGTLLMLSYYRQNKIAGVKFFSCLIFSLTLTFFSKLHIFMVMAPCLLLFAFSMRMKPLLSFLLPLLLFFMLAAFLKWFIPSADLFAFMAEKQAENIRMAIESKAGSYFEIPVLDGTPLNFILHIPSGFLNSLVRPLPYEIHSPLMLFSAVENILLHMFMGFALFRFIGNPKQPSDFFYFSVLFVVILYSVIGMMTPVSGALVRYKIQGFPFLFFALLSLLESTKKE